MMNGFLVFLVIVATMAASGGYRFALPGMYPVGREMVIQAETGCEWRDVSPVEEVEHSVRQITPWEVGVTFTGPGAVSKLEIKCIHSIFEGPVDVVHVDWLFR